MEKTRGNAGNWLSMALYRWGSICKVLKLKGLICKINLSALDPHLSSGTGHGSSRVQG